MKFENLYQCSLHLGWQPTNYSRQPSKMRGEYCVGLARQYLHPNGSAVSVQYYFFDDIKCETNNNYRFGFICEKPLQKEDQLALRQAEGKFLFILPFFLDNVFSEACLSYSLLYCALQNISKKQSFCN